MISLIIPPVFLAFFVGLSPIAECVKHPMNLFAGTWLLGFSWLQTQSPGPVCTGWDGGTFGQPSLESSPSYWPSSPSVAGFLCPPIRLARQHGDCVYQAIRFGRLVDGPLAVRRDEPTQKWISRPVPILCLALGLPLLVGAPLLLLSLSGAYSPASSTIPTQRNVHTRRASLDWWLRSRRTTSGSMKR